MMKQKQVIYFEAVCKKLDGEVILEMFKCKNTADYKVHLCDLDRIYDDVELCYREWSDGTIEDGEIEN